MEHTKSTALVILFVGGLVGARVGWTGAIVGWIGAAVGATGAGVGSTGAGVRTAGAAVGLPLLDLDPFFLADLLDLEDLEEELFPDFPPFLIPFPFLRIRDTLVAASA